MPSRWVAAILCSLVFAGAHWSHDVASLIHVFIGGCILSALVFATRSLFPGIAVHYLNNLINSV